MEKLNLDKKHKIVQDIINLGFVPKTSFVNNWQFNHMNIPNDTMVEYYWECEVQKWLRDNYNIHIEIEKWGENKYELYIHNKSGRKQDYIDGESLFNNYEFALFIGIEKSIKLIRNEN